MHTSFWGADFRKKHGGIIARRYNQLLHIAQDKINNSDPSDKTLQNPKQQIHTEKTIQSKGEIDSERETSKPQHEHFAFKSIQKTHTHRDTEILIIATYIYIYNMTCAPKLYCICLQH